MSGIILHKQLGVNPRLTFCRECGGETNELALVGIRNYKEICSNCECVCYGGMDKKCPKCGMFKSHMTLEKIELQEHERVPAVEPCDSCKEFSRQAIEAAKDGAVICKCSSCGSRFVIKGDCELAIETRKHSGIASPGMVGVKVDSCPGCKPKDDPLA